MTLRSDRRAYRPPENAGSVRFAPPSKPRLSPAAQANDLVKPVLFVLAFICAALAVGMLYLSAQARPPAALSQIANHR